MNGANRKFFFTISKILVVNIIKVIIYVVYDLAVSEDELYSAQAILHFIEIMLSLTSTVLLSIGLRKSKMYLLWTYIAIEFIPMIFIPSRLLQIAPQLIDISGRYFALSAITHGIFDYMIMILGGIYTIACFNSICMVLIQIYVPETWSANRKLEGDINASGSKKNLFSKFMCRQETQVKLNVPDDK